MPSEGKLSGRVAVVTGGARGIGRACCSALCAEGAAVGIVDIDKAAGALLATELQRVSNGDTLYVLDEPTTGLHPADVERLVAQLDRLVSAGNTVIIVEHDMRVIAGSDWVIDMGPGAGDEGGRIVATGTPEQVAASKRSRTAPYLAEFLNQVAERSPSTGTS